MAKFQFYVTRSLNGTDGPYISARKTFDTAFVVRPENGTLVFLDGFHFKTAESSSGAYTDGSDNVVKLKHNDLNTKDPATVLNFYNTLKTLGWKLKRESEFKAAHGLKNWKPEMVQNETQGGEEFDGDYKDLAVLFKSQKSLPKKEALKIKQNTWVELKWLDAPNTVALVLEKPKNQSGDVELECYQPEVAYDYQSPITLSQVVAVLGELVVPTTRKQQSDRAAASPKMGLLVSSRE